MLFLTHPVVLMLQQLNFLFDLFRAHSVWKGFVEISLFFNLQIFFLGEKKKEANSKGGQVPTVYS